MNIIGKIRGKIKSEEFDYGILLDALKEYKKPRDVITRLINQQAIIRIKKGLYVFGEPYRKNFICKESLANLIYGPSYVSLEYALSYYGLIPERVERVTSMTCLRNKTFQTPLGSFEYVHLGLKKFPVGVTLVNQDPLHQFFIATPEKALADRISSHRNLISNEDIHSFVCEGLRIEEEALSQFQYPLMKEIAYIYNNKTVTQLAEFIKEL